MKRIQKINWLDPVVKEHTDGRYTLPDIITPEIGVGDKYVYDNIERTGVAEKNRRLHLECRSFVGISIGATHYYGYVQVYGLSDKYINESGEEKIENVCGYPDKFKPDTMKSFRLEVRRQLTASDIKNGTTEDRKRWKHYRVGDYVDAFDTEKEMLHYAVSMISARFAGKWLVEIDGFYDQLRHINTETKSMTLAKFKKILKTL